MSTINYKAILEQAFAECGQMVLDRQILDLEIAKKTQFIRATLNMLPDDDRERAKYDVALHNLSGESLGLTDAIRNVLQREPEKTFTATDVRDKLKKTNFDFSSYKTNPLASIHAILKRLKPEEVEATYIEGVSAWRWVGPELIRFDDNASILDTMNALRSSIARMEPASARRKAAKALQDKIEARKKRWKELEAVLKE